MIITTKPYKDVTLEFDEEKHKFYANGEDVMSVTKITSAIDKSASLMAWQERISRDFLLDKLNQGIKINEDIILEATSLHRSKKEQAASLGDQVHKWAEEYSKGLNPVIPKDEKVKNGIMAFLKWIDESGMKIKESEINVYSKKYNYAGRLDAVGEKNRKLSILDYKTSKSIYNEMRYQVSAYKEALEEMKGKEYDRYLIHFDKETGEFHSYLLDNFKKDFKVFLGCRDIRIRENELKK